MSVALIEDEAALDSLRLLLEGRGLAVCGFASAEAFLASLPTTTPGCIVWDVRLPGPFGPRSAARAEGAGQGCAVLPVGAFGNNHRIVPIRFS